LFATSLEEKLRAPGNITDEHPGPAIVTPAMPGRPAELRFKTQGATRDFPGAHHLENETERGRLLHFFANHELLATELMALVLLKFPAAPSAFRRGVLQTLKDEQEHTRLYMDRMKDCGIHFGELPVSGYFWRAVSAMENPMDYVAGLSLTFEQANLDFAQHFSRGFAQVGDAATAKLLEKIHRDEIAHVAYGLKWFRRWKNPSESDWEAFCRQLKFPLSPQRAKGFSINMEARRAAGLDPQFIAELSVYSQSKGRTPSVFIFNPFEEGRVAQGKSFTPVKHQVQLARDLENLPQFLCRQDDIVLVSRRPSIEFLSGISEAGFPLPEFVEDVSRLRERKIGALRPWAWGPDSVELLTPLFENVTGEPRTAQQRFNESTAMLYSKSWSADLLRNILQDTDELSSHCTANEVGAPAKTMSEALDAIAKIRSRGHHKVVVKEALGLAGHNAIRLWEPALMDSQRRWIEHAVDNGRELVIEPWLERLADFSLQLEMTAGKLKRVGFTGLTNDLKGQFQANWAAPNFARRIPSSIVAFLAEPSRTEARLQIFYDDVITRLEAELKRAQYIGPAGIDAFVYRDASGSARVKPIVEINPRYTMGRLTLELMKHVCPGSFGMFRIVNRATLKSEGRTDFVSYAAALRKQFPLRLEGEPVRRIHAGALPLNDPGAAEVCLATFQVSETDPTIASRDRIHPSTSRR